MKFPNEGRSYRAARGKLLSAEKALRKKVEAVAALRRKLPAGGTLPEDYLLEGANGAVRLSQLFGSHDTLVAYSFMYGPNAANPCPIRARARLVEPAVPFFGTEHLQPRLSRRG